jgi:hypothetical protein
VREPAFYAYAAPEPPGFATAPARPRSAKYRREISNFILPYESVRTAVRPDGMVLTFFQSAYEAAVATLDRPENEWP